MKLVELLNKMIKGNDNVPVCIIDLDKDVTMFEGNVCEAAEK